ncbi:MAG: cytochrome-c peroxidase [Verrucomicrobiales bacterium]
MNRCLKPSALALVSVAAIAATTAARGEEPVAGLSLDVAASIGRSIFFDSGLSKPVGQSCYNCHLPHSAFAGETAVAEGAVIGRFGTRNVPTLMYASLVPPAKPAGEAGGVSRGRTGGLFHDGRARDPFEQVRKPFYSPDEMNLADEAALATLLRSAGYGSRMRRWIGDEAWEDDQQLSHYAYVAIVEFLRDPMFRPFDARIDDFLAGDKEALSAPEQNGFEVFAGVGKCAKCHQLDATDWSGPLLSDHSYANLGVPSRGEKDPGLGGHTGEPADLGKFRVPTLRNVALTAPYMHNGSIATLREVIEFHNRRDLEPDRWGPTDYPQTVERVELGDLALTDQQVEDLTALMATFSDRSLLGMGVGQVIPKTPKDVPTTKSLRHRFPGPTTRANASPPAVE